MITIEVHDQFVTWPEDFAETMMRYYQNHGVPFKIHRKCVHVGLSADSADRAPIKSIPAELQGHFCSYLRGE